ncbi:hypothetical protein [Psychrobacter urativorans]|nr:hypothetical protein [Psychrobacter urativorans]
MTGLTKQQVIDDVLEQYEAYLTFLTMPMETDVELEQAMLVVGRK